MCGVKRKRVAAIPIGAELTLRIAVAPPGDVVEARVYRRRSPAQGFMLHAEHVPALVEALQAAVQIAEQGT